jgi:rubredoxin
MVAGLHKAYHCKECGAAYAISKSSGQIIMLGNTDAESGLQSRKPPKPLVALKKLLGASTCPQCGSHDVFEDVKICT